MRPDELERELRQRLDALSPAPRAELFHVLMLPTSSELTGSESFRGYSRSRTFRCELVKNRARGWRRSAFAAYKCVSGCSGRRPKSPHERRNVKKALAVALIVGFLLVDFLFFHDIFKAGETVTFAQYLTGVLSIPVLVVSALYLLRGTWTVQK